MSFRPSPRRVLSSVFLPLFMLAGFAGGSRIDNPNRSGKALPSPVEQKLTRATPFTGDLRRLPHTPPVKRERPERQAPVQDLAGELGAIGSGVAVPSLAIPAPSPIASFEGLDFANWGSGHPPDTNGDVGPEYYIQTVNTSIGVYRKSDGVRVAAFTFDTFMSQGNFGNLCDTDNYGDPVVVYDTFADRWIITDFAFQLDANGGVVSPPGAYQCFAASQSGDPVSGGWNFYSINITDKLNDYPKFGIWPDGLYMSANMYGFSAHGSFSNVRVWAFNKAQMYAGTPTAQVVTFDAAKVSGGGTNFTLLPANARLQTGTPPAGRENLFAALTGFTNVVRIWKFHVDWNNVANSTFIGPTDAPTGATWSPGPGTVPELDGNTLDTLTYRAMMQNQYTNIGGVESLWNSHTVAGSSSSQAAVRWYQVPVTGSTIGSALQASTYNPDSRNRFMPSAAVDRIGNMAIGYSVSNAAMYPAIRYSGRLAGDAANTITQTETSLIEGTGGQVHTFSDGTLDHRWGDYSAMTLDPDGCTFWYTNEYYVTNGADDHTRIGSFRFPQCSPLAPGASLNTLTPCRIADTRNAPGPLGGPSLVGGAARDFPVAGVCGVAFSAKAVAVNVTVVNPTAAGYLTLFPAGGGLPLASTINFNTAIVRANNAVIPLGTAGQVSVFCGMASGTTDFVLDVTGYFE